MNEITGKDKVFLNIAKEIASFSKCVSFQVGSVIVRDGRILSTGYNGAPPKFKNCNEIFSKPFDREKHHAWSDGNEIHAEINSIIFAAKEGIKINGSVMYCTLQPCNNCLKNIFASGITRIVFSEKYDKCKYSDEILENIILTDNQIILKIPNE
jgi:dCMP deaminase